jgi:hypothetical protein
LFINLLIYAHANFGHETFYPLASTKGYPPAARAVLEQYRQHDFSFLGGKPGADTHARTRRKRAVLIHTRVDALPAIGGKAVELLKQFLCG